MDHCALDIGLVGTKYPADHGELQTDVRERYTNQMAALAAEQTLAGQHCSVLALRSNRDGEGQ